MKISHVLLLVLVGMLVAAVPAKSYADPQLDTLVNIANQARDNLGATISQMSNVPDSINQLYKEGSNETDALAQAASQDDVGAAKQHFLAAMKFFKETNDKINSLGSASAPTEQQAAQTQELRGEVVRLENVGKLLKTIASQNSVPVNFTAFDQMMQAASQDLDSGNLTDASTQISTANDFIAATHNALTQAAQAKITERAKDFTERQIEQMNSTQPGPVPQNTTVQQANPGQNGTAPSSLPPSPPLTPQPNSSPNIPAAGNPITMGKNPQEMVSELKKLVAEGKVDQAIILIKMIQAYQHEQLAQKASEISAEHNQTKENQQHAPGLVQTIVPPVQNTTAPAQQQNNIPPPSSPPQAQNSNPQPVQNGTVAGQNTTAPTPQNPAGNNTAPNQNSTIPAPPPLPTPPQNGTVQAPPGPPSQQNGTVQSPPTPPAQPNTPPAQNSTNSAPPAQPNQPAPQQNTTGTVQPDHPGHANNQHHGNQSEKQNENNRSQGNDNNQKSNNNQRKDNYQWGGNNFPWIQRQDHRRG